MTPLDTPPASVLQMHPMNTQTPAQHVEQLIEAGLSPEDIASKVSVSKDTIRRWRDGTTHPRRGDARRLARIYRAVMARQETT